MSPGVEACADYPSVRRAGQRAQSRPGDGIRSWHSFSAGAHYDPDNVAFGPIVGLDEHHLAPGAGFGSHPHRGVEIVSWVLAGTLDHRTADGERLLVPPGQLLHQHTGAGVEHTETNAATDELLLLQLTLLGDASPPSTRLAADRLRLATQHGDAAVELHYAGRLQLGGPALVFVANGLFEVRSGDAVARLGPGDEARLAASAELEGAGAALVVRLPG